MAEEIWKDIEGCEGCYQISNFGNVLSFKRKTPMLLSPNIDDKGYYSISLYFKGVKKIFRVHRLVALHFIEKVDGMLEVNHIDRNKLNNHVSNLEWADDFIQNSNKDCVINAKHYCICFQKNNKFPSKWRVQWREDGKGRCKYFKTEEETREWAEKELSLKTLEKLNKPKPRK